MSKIFVQLQGDRIKRMSNKLDGHGWDDSNPYGKHLRRRQERRTAARDLALLLQDDDAMVVDAGFTEKPVATGSGNGRNLACEDDSFYMPSEGRLKLVRSQETGMLTFASYGNGYGDSYQRRRRHRHW